MIGTWEQWCKEVRAELERRGIPQDADPGESWRDYYDEGYTPAGAVAEDMSYTKR